MPLSIEDEVRLYHEARGTTEKPYHRPPPKKGWWKEWVIGMSVLMGLVLVPVGCVGALAATSGPSHRDPAPIASHKQHLWVGMCKQLKQEYQIDLNRTDWSYLHKVDATSRIQDLMQQVYHCQ